MNFKNNNKASIVAVKGPLVVAKNVQNASLFGMAKVGNLQLIGEVIQLHNDTASIQVYENTTGLTPNEEVCFLNNFTLKK